MRANYIIVTASKLVTQKYTLSDDVFAGIWRRRGFFSRFVGGREDETPDAHKVLVGGIGQ